MPEPTNPSGYCDLLVIGAGIQGAAVALAAVRRGLRVQLVEQYAEPACATSSRSSKLIHGGLRYLETGQFALVRECLAAQRRLLRERPQLVQLKPFLIPVYETTRRPPWKIGAGLALYRLLGGHPFETVPRRDWSRLDGLKTHGLRRVYRYYDAQTDDRALTRALIEDARREGLICHFDTRLRTGRLTTNTCELVCDGPAGPLEVQGRALVNAAGPWVNQVLECLVPRPPGLDIEWVQGSHIRLPGRLEQGIYYVEAPQDGRAVFVMPWQGDILIGTTETAFRGDPARVRPLPDECRYLLEVYEYYFGRGLGEADILQAFAGLRVLPAGNGTAFSRPRDTRIHRHPTAPRVISVYGGKLTTHASTARKVLDCLSLD
ncbi:MAG TPA: FAD-dependent oxidoreductase [Thiotrichales bacterium]|nr:FAD-dependent oxidoreductase [Thiotrichales bacterium]